MTNRHDLIFGDSVCRFSKSPQNILIIKRPKSPNATSLAIELGEFLFTVYNAILYCEEDALDDLNKYDFNFKFISIKGIKEDLGEIIDLAICLGGDGTLLWLSHLFQTSVPPVVSIAMGSLGYMALFHYTRAHDIIDRIMKKRTFAVTLRSRLSLYALLEDGNINHTSCLNECVFERGNRHCLVSLDVYCSGCYFTRVFADGLILATPSGSTAYSMSAGGSIVHPKVPGILFTPICPHTLSFRPVILPESTELLIYVPNTSRNGVQVAADGRSVVELKTGEFAVIKMCPYPLPLVLCPQLYELPAKNMEFNPETKTRRRSVGEVPMRTMNLKSVSNESLNNSYINKQIEFEKSLYYCINEKTALLTFVCPVCWKDYDCMCGLSELNTVYIEGNQAYYKRDYWLDSLKISLDWNSQRTVQAPIDLTSVHSNKNKTLTSNFYEQKMTKLHSYNFNFPRRTLSKLDISEEQMIPQHAVCFLRKIRQLSHLNIDDRYGNYIVDQKVSCINSSKGSFNEYNYDYESSFCKTQTDKSVPSSSTNTENNFQHRKSTSKNRTPFFTPVKMPGMIILDRKVDE
ncbi:NAD kinase family protein [Cryptosporidium serpentis]